MATYEKSSCPTDRHFRTRKYSPPKTVSRSHLPKLLEKINGDSFAKLIFSYYGITLSEQEKAWFALDGKELKGSILPMDTRGEAVALAVRHSDRAVYQMSFFNGSKESEVVAVRELLASPLCNQKTTMDALHFKPNTLIPIHQAGGVFLVSLKNNQKELLEEMEFSAKNNKAAYQDESKIEKGHGREEQRSYWCYDIGGEYIDKRWEQAGFKYLIKVKRKRTICNRNKFSEETAYFLTNRNVQNRGDAMELFQAIRQHWQVEIANSTRDCNLKEDKLRCISTKTNRTMALCRTLVIKLLNQSPIKNRCELMENFADNFEQCISFLKKLNFL